MSPPLHGNTDASFQDDPVTEHPGFTLSACDNGIVLKSGDVKIGIFEICRNTDFECSDAITPSGEDVFLWERKCTVREATESSFHMDFRALHSPEFWLIPGMCYNGNPFGAGDDTKGFRYEDEPITYAIHRASLPGGTFTKGSEWTVGMMAHTADGSFSIFQDNAHSIVHRLILPEEEMPLHYVERKMIDGKHVEIYAEGFRKKARWGKGETFTRRAWLVVHRARKYPQPPYRRFLDVGWEQFRNDEPAAIYTPEDIWKIGLRYIRESLWDTEAGFFATGLRFIDGRWSRLKKYAAGWVGQNLSLANSFLYDYQLTGNEKHREIALMCLDNWVSRSLKENGIFIGAHGADGKRGGHTNANHMGKACEQFFEAGQLAIDCGMNGIDFLEAALRICEFALSQQEPSGLVPGNWNEDGTVAESRGTIGSCFIGPWVMAYEKTKNARFLTAAQKSFEYYIAFLRWRGFLGGATLDTFCIERESGFSVVVGGLRLYQATGDKAYLLAAEEAAYYVASWQFGYKAPSYAKGTPLAQVDYNTRGGTAVATVHPCMDFHALEVMDDFYVLGEWLGKPIWKERALSAWKHAQQGISDGTLSFMNRPPRPFGSQDETWFYTHWGLWAPASGNAIPDHPRGHTSQWLVSKPTAGRLEVLRRFGHESWHLLEQEVSETCSTTPESFYP